MIHYHGLPITPETALHPALNCGHGFISYSEARNLSAITEICQSFALDNGAFSAWSSGKPILDWSGFYSWAQEARKIPGCDFACIPDVIDGSEADNDALLKEWPLPRWFGAPVWHMHESLERLERLAADFPRIALGSTGAYRRPGTSDWWGRMAEAMEVLCDAEGRPLTRIHGLRMLSIEIFPYLPLASADSTNLARNIGIDQRWTGSYAPPTKEFRAASLRARIESINGVARWSFQSPKPISRMRRRSLWAEE